MKKNKLWIVVGMIIFIVAVGMLALACLAYNSSLPIWSGIFSGERSMEMTNEVILQLEDIDTVTIKYRSPEILVYEGKGEELVIREYMRTKDVDAQAVVNRQNGKIEVREGNRYPTIGFLFSMARNEHVEIYLPKSYKGNVELSTSSGSIRTESSWEWQNCKLSSTSGNIRVTDIAAGEVRVSASSGAISMGAVTAENAELTTNSGNVRAERISAQDFRLSCTSGTISLGDGNGQLRASASSGNIKIDKMTGNADVTTTSGSITLMQADGDVKAAASSGKVMVQSVAADGVLNLTTTSGSTHLTVPKASSFAVEIETTSGSIRTDMDEVLHFNKKGNHAEGTYGDKAQGSIKIRTSSGSANLRLE